MSYDKVNDFEDVQADVLTTDTSSNTKISKLKQLKTATKVPTKAINATYEQLGNAQASAADAMQRVVALETASGGNGGEVQQVDTSDLKVMLSQLLREVKSWGGYARGGTRLGKRVELDVVDITEANSLLPTAIVDVQLANSAPVDNVNVYWDVDILHDAGEHVIGQHDRLHERGGDVWSRSPQRRPTPRGGRVNVTALVFFPCLGVLQNEPTLW